MPEGQVSHRNSLTLTAALAGQVVRRIETPEPRLVPQRIPDRLLGETIVSVDAAGKHHLFRFASGRVLHSHLGMGGSWRLSTAQRVPTTRRLWLAVWTDQHVVAQYGGPQLRLYEPNEPIPMLRGLGTDLLNADADPAEATARALAAIDPGRAVGEALMDQRVVSGIGNVYRSETLFLCGIDPWRTVGSLTVEEARELGRTGARLLSEGVSHRGPITTYRTPDPRSRERTWVYGRSNRPCRRCGKPINSRGMGDTNRTVYWCPTCQT